MTTITHLECSQCGTRHEAGQPHNLCTACNSPLIVRYDLNQARESWSRDSLAAARSDMWRYSTVLPVRDEANVVTLGEGWTPMLRTAELGKSLGAADLWVKDEGLNPTGSFKARGLSCALSMCKELRIGKVAIPSAGNAGGACATYAATAGIEAHVFMPQDVPHSNFVECSAVGAKVTLVDGLISDCGRIVAERKAAEGWFEVSTLKEPYRIEGKKTMGYEVAEQFGWELPDAILYPAGGGVGLIGMWKAFDELEAMGWLKTGSKRPKMIAVQAEGCQPVVEAWKAGKDRAEFFQNAATVASGLRVPKPLGDALMIRAMRETGGTAIGISDADMLDAALLLGRTEGVFAAPEGGACVAAVQQLIAQGYLKPSERLVVFNTGTGLKYMEAFSTRFPRHTRGEADKLGGLITPR
jgi:threonine synthase